MRPKFLATLITLFIVLVVALAVYLQKYNPEIYGWVLLSILSFVILSVIWSLTYLGIEKNKNKKVKNVNIWQQH
jgi:membrane protease YdiL (CAAX protease family)